MEPTLLGELHKAAQARRYPARTFFQSVRGHDQALANRALVRRMLMVILRWQWMSMRRHGIYSAALTPVNTGVRRLLPRLVDVVERGISAVLEVILILEDCHLDLRSWGKSIFA